MLQMNSDMSEVTQAKLQHMGPRDCSVKLTHVKNYLFLVCGLIRPQFVISSLLPSSVFANILARYSKKKRDFSFPFVYRCFGYKCANLQITP